MPLVNVMVNGRAYTLGCDEGEEEHLKQLAALVDSKAREALGMVGLNAGDTKLLLMAALLVADEHYDMTAKLAASTRMLENSAVDTKLEDGGRESLNDRAQEAEDRAAQMLEAAAQRVEAVAAGLASA